MNMQQNTTKAIYGAQLQSNNGLVALQLIPSTICKIPLKARAKIK